MHTPLTRRRALQALAAMVASTRASAADGIQLLAQRQRPDSFVVVVGYGESATGYVPTEQHLKDGDGNLDDWSWVAPDCEKVMSDAIAAALKK